MKTHTLLSTLALACAMSLGSAHAQEPVWDGNKVVMRAETLAPGVHLYVPQDAREINAKGGAAATTGGLIVGSKAALLVETMLNKRLNSQVQALSRKLTRLPTWARSGRTCSQRLTKA